MALSQGKWVGQEPYKISSTWDQGMDASGGNSFSIHSKKAFCESCIFVIGTGECFELHLVKGTLNS